MSIFEIQGAVMVVVFFVLLAVKLFAFVNCLMYESEAYTAAGKLTKPAWAAILGLALAIQVLPINLLFVNLALTIAAFVYLADVRPALAGLRRR